MSMYYLISQLPSLDGVGENTPVPITEERFAELCHTFLGKKAQSEMDRLTLVPPKNGTKSSSPLIEAWNEGERKLRLALAKVRADRMKKAFDTEIKELPVELVRVANTAVEMDNPLEAEKYLDSYRLAFLETLRPMDAFSEDSVFYYGLKLKLILRAGQFDSNTGETAYREIYTSILNGDRVEDIQ